MLRRCTLLLMCLAVLLVGGAAVAQAQDASPFSPLPPAETTPAPTPTVSSSTSTSSDDDGGLKGWQDVLIFAGGGILLIGIAWAIVSDARSHAPEGVDDTESQREARAKREEDIKRRKAKNRAATKRQRAARKRNR